MTFPSKQVESAARALVLLETLNQRRVSSIQMLHTTTGLPKGTIVRLLKTLCGMGYAANDRRQGGYTVASRVRSLSVGFYGAPLVAEAVRPWALAFTREHHWPLSLAVLDGPSMVIRFTTTPDSPLAPLQSMVNRRLSLLSRAMGRVYLAFCPEGEREILLDLLSRSSELEDKLVPENGDVLELLKEVRKQGYAERHPSIDPTSSTLAVPIVLGETVLATIGMTFFASALKHSDRVNRFVPLLQQVAKDVGNSVASLKE